MAEVSLSTLRKEALANGSIGSGNVLPGDTYTAEVVESTTLLNANEKRQFKVKFRVITGPEKDGTVRETITISPESEKALGIAFSKLDALGATPTIDRGAEPDEIAKVMLGSIVSIVTYVEDYQGRPVSKVRFINAIATEGRSTAEVGTTEAAAGKKVPF